MIWQWPQITWVILALLALTTHAASHGEPTKSTWNFPLKLMSVVISIIILYFGGFFTEFRP